MMKIILVGVGGFCGAVSRYLLSGWVYQLVSRPYFPYGTMAVNILGCFVLGFVGGLSETRQVFSPEARLFLFIGVLGGFTTFSTYMYESFLFARDGQLLTSAGNALLQLAGGFGAVWLGMLLANLLSGGTS